MKLISYLHYIMLLFTCISSGCAFDPVVYPASIEPYTECRPAAGDTIFSDQLLEGLTTAHQRLPLQGCLRATRVSCADILYCNSSASSGYYPIKAANGSKVQVYCDMEGTNCGGEGGWTRVVHLNMTDISSQCPTNFSIVTENEIRFCVKNDVGCFALPSETFGIAFSQVCGYARGYSYHTTDAFGHANRDPNEPLSGNYVDGVSVTYGTPPRHLWTYVAGFSEDGVNVASYNCPCNTNIVSTPPLFVGNDYYCEAGGIPQANWPVDDPLWDGNMCGGTEGPCCNRAGLPWFRKQLPSHTMDSIRVRICTDQGSGDENVSWNGTDCFVCKIKNAQNNAHMYMYGCMHCDI